MTDTIEQHNPIFDIKNGDFVHSWLLYKYDGLWSYSDEYNEEKYHRDLLIAIWKPKNGAKWRFVMRWLYTEHPGEPHEDDIKSAYGYSTTNNGDQILKMMYAIMEREKQLTGLDNHLVSEVKVKAQWNAKVAKKTLSTLGSYQMVVTNGQKHWNKLTDENLN